MKVFRCHRSLFQTQHCGICRLNHDVAASRSVLDDPKALALLVSNSAHLNQLRQIFAHIIRTHFLDFHPQSFHYNNISRIFSRLESPREALHVYIAMCRAGVTPDNFTIPVVLKASGQSLDVLLSKQVHGIAIKYGFENDMYCESGFISFYCKAGEIVNARKVFDNSTERKLGSWNALIGGLSQGGRAKEALEMFMSMMKQGISPDDVTMVSMTSACGSLGDLNLALQLHKCVIQAKRFDKSDTLMMNSLIDMYGKCGRTDLACKVFSRMDVKNVSSWTSMIVGYAAHGYVTEALLCFDSMIEEGIEPNNITFVGVLSACVHGGMVQEGKYYFNMMTADYGIHPTLPHYGCMVDLLGRSGLHHEAKMMVETMPLKANVVIWGCLMGACEKFGNVQMGEWVAKHLIELEPENEGVFVALSNIYASHGMWEEVERLRENMKETTGAKVPAYSSPEGEGEASV